MKNDIKSITLHLCSGWYGLRFFQLINMRNYPMSIYIKSAPNTFNILEKRRDLERYIVYYELNIIHNIFRCLFFPQNDVYKTK